MISVHEKGTISPVKLKLQEESLNKYIKKENFRKDLMSLTETNQQINMTSDHSVSSNNSFKSI